MERDIPLEEAQKEMLAMKTLVSQHRERVRRFGKESVADDAFTQRFAAEARRLESELEQMDHQLSETRTEVTALKGWVLRDTDALASAEKRLSRLRRDKERAAPEVPLDPITSEALARVTKRSQEIADQLELISETLREDWSDFVAASSGSLKVQDQEDLVMRVIHDSGSSLSALESAVAAMEARLGIPSR